eukprot:3266980-Alexandrium_andersonii.AAC.1
MSSGSKIQPEGPQSKHAQQARRPSLRLRIGESRRPPSAGGAARSAAPPVPVSYTHLRAHETSAHL